MFIHMPGLASASGGSIVSSRVGFDNWASRSTIVTRVCGIVQIVKRGTIACLATGLRSCHNCATGLGWHKQSIICHI